MLKLTQFEKTGSIGKTFVSLGNLIINFHFRNRKSITFFGTFTILLFDSGVCLPFNNRNAMNLKKIKRQTAKNHSLRSLKNFQLPFDYFIRIIVYMNGNLSSKSLCNIHFTI